MTGTEDVVRRLEEIEEELSDLAMKKLREGIESGDASAAADEKLITRARRSIEKATQLLSPS